MHFLGKYNKKIFAILSLINSSFDLVRTDPYGCEIDKL